MYAYFTSLVFSDALDDVDKRSVVTKSPIRFVFKMQ